MKLKDLLPNCDSQIDVLGIEIDSRLVKKGAVFFALQGHNVDGAKFIDDAISKGAVAVVVSRKSLVVSRGMVIEVDDVYQNLIQALQKFYPNLPENILAVTGTNGKTSVAYFIQQMQEIIGRKAASIGTIGIKTSDLSIQKELISFALTTPDIVSLYKNLSILKQHGINDIAIEASSIGLEQKRLAGLKIGVGAFTNFTQDHLDYHGSMEKYFECKMLLFKETVCDDGIAVLNADISEFEKIKEIALKRGLRVFSYTLRSSSHSVESSSHFVESSSHSVKSSSHSLNSSSHSLNSSSHYLNSSSHSLNSSSHSLNSSSQRKLGSQLVGRDPSFRWDDDSKEWDDNSTKWDDDLFIKFKLAGDFQKANLLCALLSVISHYKLNQQQIELLINNLDKIKPAEGRMQLAATLKNSAQIFIDYAHTPDALQNVLTAAKKMAHKNLYVLFGCGGDRDHSKRPQMGKIACDLADFVIVTDDNPRTETAAEIRKEILLACDLTKTIEISDRRNAIKQTITKLQDNDVLIIAGKGHEKYQIIGTEKLAFDEEVIVKDLTKDK